VTDTAGEDKSTRFKAGLQIVQKLVFEQLRQYLYVDKEVFTAWHLDVIYYLMSVQGCLIEEFDAAYIGLECPLG
jgi:hypothetical protein